MNGCLFPACSSTALLLVAVQGVPGPSMNAWWASSVGSLPVLGWIGRPWVAPAQSEVGGVVAFHLFFHLSPKRLNFGLPGYVRPPESGL